MKLTKGYLAFIILIILGIFFYIPRIYQGYRTLNELENKLTELTFETQELENQMKELTLQLNNSDDLYYIEKFARDNLAMKKKNETIYRIIYEEDIN
jgi:cell division protein FtsB